MTEETTFTSRRQRMITEQIISRGIQDPRVIDALRMTPRHLFVPPESQDLAYMDGPLPIGQSQTISQPYIVALMTELLELEGPETVLEVGTGSGYQAAILAHLARQVYTIERHTALAIQARRVLEELGLDNVEVHIGDGSCGLPKHAPYQAIIVTAAAPRAPKPLLDQLTDDGRLLIPVGSLGGQMLERWQRSGMEFTCEEILPVAFVPLRGEHGWEEDRHSLFF